MNHLLAGAAALVTVLIVSGCASTDPVSGDAAPREELVFRTGSNIPLRDKTPMTKEEKEKRSEESRRTLQQMQSTGAGRPKTD
jgi:hypothetical protein